MNLKLSTKTCETAVTAQLTVTRGGDTVLSAGAARDSLAAGWWE